MHARIITKAPNNLTTKEVEYFILPIFQGLLDLQIPVYGFGYEPNEGIFVVGPREELEKLKNDNIEDFDFIDYIKNTNQPFWSVDITDGLENLSLKRYEK